MLYIYKDIYTHFSHIYFINIYIFIYVYMKKPTLSTLLNLNIQKVGNNLCPHFLGGFALDSWNWLCRQG